MFQLTCGYQVEFIDSGASDTADNANVTSVALETFVIVHGFLSGAEGFSAMQVGMSH